MKKALLLLVTIMLWSCSDRNEDIVIDGELHMSVDELPRIDSSDLSAAPHQPSPWA